MANSVVYSGIFGAVLASIRALSTRMIVFDTAVVDLTEDLHDPVDLLFGARLGGGTDINRALAYCQGLIARPAQTILVLITDLYEGGNADEMIKRAATLVASGVQVVCLLALNDSGAPIYDERHAVAFATLGIPTFACTPDLFPDCSPPRSVGVTSTSGPRSRRSSPRAPARSLRNTSKSRTSAGVNPATARRPIVARLLL
jgi:hypothetical protein